MCAIPCVLVHRLRDRCNAQHRISNAMKSATPLRELSLFELRRPPEAAFRLESPPASGAVAGIPRHRGSLARASTSDRIDCERRRCSHPPDVCTCHRTTHSDGNYRRHGDNSETLKQRSASNDGEAVVRCRQHGVSAGASICPSGKPADLRDILTRLPQHETSENAASLPPR